MRHIPRSSYGSKVPRSTYYIPGGFCLPAQPPIPDHDVVPDLGAGSGLEPVRSVGGFATA